MCVRGNPIPDSFEAHRLLVLAESAGVSPAFWQISQKEACEKSGHAVKKPAGRRRSGPQPLDRQARRLAEATPMT